MITIHFVTFFQVSITRFRTRIMLLHIQLPSLSLNIYDQPNFQKQIYCKMTDYLLNVICTMQCIFSSHVLSNCAKPTKPNRNRSIRREITRNSLANYPGTCLGFQISECWHVRVCPTRCPLIHCKPTMNNDICPGAVREDGLLV